jgi:ABC-type Mn2+/Zn2+ transport system permease subunit
MGLGFYLRQPFAQHALVAATLVAVAAGIIGPFVVVRGAAFAVHGTAELSFTGAAAGLVAGGDPLVGALLGSLVVAAWPSGSASASTCSGATTASRARPRTSCSARSSGCRAGSWRSWPAWPAG